MFDNPFKPLHGGSFALAVILTVILWVALMAVFHGMGNSSRKRVTKMLAFIGGAYYLLEFLIPDPVLGAANPLSPFIEPLGRAQKVFFGLALMLGVVNLFRINGRAIMRKRAGSWYSWVFFAGFFAMLSAWALNYYQWGGTGNLSVTARDAQLLGTTIDSKRALYAGFYQVMYEGFFNGLSATMFSLLAFFIVSAAYRAFRVRNAEAVLLLVSAVVMMLGLTPLGTYFLTGWIPENSTFAFLKLDRVSEWILMVLNGAAQRALLFGIAMGLMATGLRIWLSLEQGQFFDADV